MGIGPTFQYTTCIFVLPISGQAPSLQSPAPIRRISSMVSAIIAKCGRTAWPSGESRTGGPRSNNAPPSSCSNRRMAIESDGCETPQLAAARVNPRASQIARKYLICGRSTVQTAQARQQDKHYELRRRRRCAPYPPRKRGQELRRDQRGKAPRSAHCGSEQRHPPGRPESRFMVSGRNNAVLLSAAIDLFLRAVLGSVLRRRSRP
jgi:hypothetical protein